MNGEQQPLFRRRRQLPTSVTTDRLPGYMKPTFGSSQKALLNRSRTLSLSASVTSRPQSSPVTLSSTLNLQQVSPLHRYYLSRIIGRRFRMDLSRSVAWAGEG